MQVGQQMVVADEVVARPSQMLIAQLWAQEPSERPSMQRVVSFLESFIAERIPQEWDDAHVRKGCFGAQ